MAVVLAALLLSMRKQRVQTAHQIVQMRRSIERSRRGLWDLQLEVSRQLEPKTLRRAIEDMAPEEYDFAGYYGRWAAAVAALMIEKGVVTIDELRAKLAELQPEDQEHD